MHRGGYIVCMVKITVRLVGRSNISLFPRI